MDRGNRMVPRTLSRIGKVARYDLRNLLYPLRYPQYFLKGIYLFNGNRIVRHASARIDVQEGKLQFGCFWRFWKRPGGIILHQGASLTIKGDVVIGDGVIIEVHPGACLEIGAGTFINPGARVLVLKSVHIGSDCAIAWEVQIMDGDRHTFLDPEGNPETNTEAIHIGDHVWIGARSLLLKGTRIGDGAVVGAGSVVTGNVKRGSAVAGNPARTIRDGVRWTK